VQVGMGRERLNIGGGMLMGRVHVNFASGLPTCTERGSADGPCVSGL
jgi:hypothetical protein